jgi:trimethylamine:corrinoid methyltransferase-like protein
VDHQLALEKLFVAGAQPDKSNGEVRLSVALIEEAFQTVPKTFVARQEILSLI